MFDVLLASGSKGPLTRFTTLQQEVVTLAHYYPYAPHFSDERRQIAIFKKVLLAWFFNRSPVRVGTYRCCD